MSAGYWTCQRVTAGAKCGAHNESRRRKCYACGKTRPPKRQPAHRAALKLPYEHYLQLQGGEWCGICGAEQGARRLHRDHDHRTGKPRGLLCFRCNAALRPYMDLEWLRGAVEYVERTTETCDGCGKETPTTFAPEFSANFCAGCTTNLGAAA